MGGSIRKMDKEFVNIHHKINYKSKLMEYAQEENYPLDMRFEQFRYASQFITSVSLNRCGIGWKFKELLYEREANVSPQTQINIMASWYLGKIQYQKETEAGHLKIHHEAFLIDAVSYTEAEARLFEKVTKTTPDFKLKSLVPMKLSEIFFTESGSEIWYKAKVQYISFDERTQKEKKIPHIMLINAENPKEVFEGLQERLGNLNDYQITDINITPIMKVWIYVA